MYGRSRSSRNEGNSSSRNNTYNRSSRRNRDEEAEEEEEDVVQPSKKRRQQVDSRGASSSNRRGARQPEIEQEEEAEEEVEDDDDDGIIVDDDDDDDEEPDGEGDGGLWGILPIKKLKVSKTAQTAAETIGKEDVKRRANDLARLALFNEHRRTALKREDITKKVLDKASAKAFPVVFNRAQKVLRYTFGYEMVELRVKGIDNDQIKLAGQSQATNGNKEEEDTKAGAKAVKSRTYVLRSLLPAKAIAAMATPTAVLSAPVNNVNEGVEGQPFDSEGVMLDWKRSNAELGSMGILFLVLSMILLSGRSISDDQLRSYLRRMHLDPQKVLPQAVQPDAGKETINNGLTMDDYLTLLQKQSYLECNRTGAGPQGAMSMDAGSLIGKRVQARGRKSKQEEGESTPEELEWRWGARAEVEITEKAVADFVSQVYLDTEDQDDADAGQDDGEATSRTKKQEQLLKHIEHAAGSQLIS